MFHFEISEPNYGLIYVLEKLKTHGITENSRNGPVIRFPRPVCLEYTSPQTRVMNLSVRDANPFFHLFETMWMFAGMDEIQPLLLFNEGMKQYSDDGKKLRGTAYGKRWRQTWGDQILRVVDMLKQNPESRQVVMSMWDPREIFELNSKDFACNLQVMFSTRPSPPGEHGNRILDMTVTNRSNDLIYGAMGSNLFHFSMLLEWVAFHSNLEIGKYYQIANNLHLYTENPTAKRCLDYSGSVKRPAKIDDSLSKLSLELSRTPIEAYVRDHTASVQEGGYLDKVVRPIVEAYRLYKIKSQYGVYIEPSKKLDVCCEIAENCESLELREAAIEWFQRRRKLKV